MVELFKKQMSIRAKCVAVVLGLVTFSSVRAADVTGVWRAEFDTQIGVQKYVYTLKQDDDKVTGKASADIGGEKRDVTLQLVAKRIGSGEAQPSANETRREPNRGRRGGRSLSGRLSSRTR
jgi:hypothetical protein